MTIRDTKIRNPEGIKNFRNFDKPRIGLEADDFREGGCTERARFLLAWIFNLCLLNE
jgi:hypothetical protein